MKYPVTSSDIHRLKIAAQCVADALVEETGCSTLSSFARCDLLARAMGYKGFSDLTYHAKQRQQVSSLSTDNLLLRDGLGTALTSELKLYINSIEASSSDNLSLFRLLMKAAVAYQVRLGGDSDVLNRRLNEYLLNTQYQGPKGEPLFIPDMKPALEKVIAIAKQTENRTPVEEVKPKLEELVAILKNASETAENTKMKLEDYEAFCKDIDPRHVKSRDDKLFALQSDRDRLKDVIDPDSPAMIWLNQEIAKLEAFA